MRREFHQSSFLLARQCSGSPGTCNPEETGLLGLPMSWSPTLFSGSGPVGLPPVPWTENNWKFAIFHPTLRSLLPRKPGWTDSFPNFFWVACESSRNWPRSVLSFMGSMINKFRVWPLQLVSFLVRLWTVSTPPRTQGKQVADGTHQTSVWSHHSTKAWIPAYKIGVRYQSQSVTDCFMLTSVVHRLLVSWFSNW